MGGARLVHAAADEVQPGETRIRANPWRGVAATAAGLLLVVVSQFGRRLPDAELEQLVYRSAEREGD